MSILLLLNGMVKAFLSIHDKHNTPLRLRAIMRIKRGTVAQDVYNCQHGNVKYIVASAIIRVEVSTVSIACISSVFE